MRDALAVLAWVAVGVGIVVALWVWMPPPIDYGACLKSHLVHRHRDAYIAPTMGFDGELTLTVVDAEDWDEVVCGQWEFPNGRAEQG